MNETNIYSNPLDLLVENIIDIARENRIDEARIYIKDRIEKDVIQRCDYYGNEAINTRVALGMCDRYRAQLKELANALRLAKDTIRAFNGLGLTGEAEQACWDAYQHSPEMKQINAALDEYEAV